MIVNEKLNLKWNTASEKNSERFDIMNSNNGIDFEKIASVKAAGNSRSQNTYTYVLENKSAYGNYFRLDMIDKNSSYKSSETVMVNENCDIKDEAPSVYYDPQSGIVITSINKNSGSYVLTILDASGRLIRTNSLSFDPGFNKTVIDPHLANGIYLVNLLFSNGEIVSKKIPVF